MKIHKLTLSTVSGRPPGVSVHKLTLSSITGRPPGVSIHKLTLQTVSGLGDAPVTPGAGMDISILW